MADIFISYKREDKHLAEDTIHALKQAGFSVWYDERIDPHTSWDETIEREIAAAKAVVVLWTPRSVASQWVRNEPLQDLIFLRVLNDDVGAATEPIGSGTCAIPSTGCTIDRATVEVIAAPCPS